MARYAKSVRHRVKDLGSYISLRDVYEIPRLVSQSVLAWILPEITWRSACHALARFNVATQPTRTRKEIAQIAAVLAGTHAASEARRIAIENWADRYEARFQYLRAWRPGGWAPEIEVLGEKHVSAALERGRGIIFWGGNFSFNDLVAKMAMHRLGFAVTAFSVPRHGFSKTPFGARYINWVCRDIENRSIGERLMVEREAFANALSRMRERLKLNEAVYFAVGGRGRRTATVRFIGDHIILATGPLAMAHITGAAILPIYTLRVAPGRFEVTIGPPLEISKNPDGNADYAAAAQAYADALTPIVLREPGQWHGWRLIRPWLPWGVKRRDWDKGAQTSQQSCLI
jgi:lauroyl/myristoyl acyltransferase